MIQKYQRNIMKTIFTKILFSKKDDQLIIHRKYIANNKKKNRNGNVRRQENKCKKYLRILKYEKCFYKSISTEIIFQG